ncbi:MAG: hypothetical protein ABSH56_36640 [Bryobacteraceae bacterium]|jgi:hypothetical protein
MQHNVVAVQAAPGTNRSCTYVPSSGLAIVAGEGPGQVNASHANYESWALGYDASGCPLLER